MEPRFKDNDGTSTVKQLARGNPKTMELRRDPEKRRQQNLKAQRKYRDKRRQRILELEKLATTIDSAPAMGSTYRQDVQCQEPCHFNPFQVSKTICKPPDQPPQPMSTQTSSEVVPNSNGPHSGTLSTTTLCGDDTVTPMAPTWPWNATNVTNDKFTSGTWTIQFVDCGCQVPHIPTQTPPDLASISPRPASNQTFEPVTLFPDPYANTLRLEKLCSVEAMRRNCLAIGISVNMCYSDDSVSPFFRDANYNTILSGSLVQSVQSIFQTLKPDMRPCTEQITISHHPYIDILPFPSVRANLIMNIGSIDEDEFFFDSINGLICWGSAGLSKGGTAGVGTGTPWDIRSWEAKEWFIQKWWFIVGGEDGELVKQSRWWRAQRGEDVE